MRCVAVPAQARTLLPQPRRRVPLPRAIQIFDSPSAHLHGAFRKLFTALTQMQMAAYRSFDRVHLQEALRKLFYRIDANVDGTVDWDEFSQYMLLENQGMAAIMENKQRRELHAPAIPKARADAGHSKMIECCSIVPPCGGSSARYATGARDGTVKLWETKARISHPACLRAAKDMHNDQQVACVAHRRMQSGDWR